MRDRVREHGLFAVALTLGTALRVLVMVGFFPSFLFSDGPTYLGFITDSHPALDRTAGYGVLVKALSWLTPDVWAIAFLQHLLGLATALLIYVVLRRWGVRSVVATLATLPVLLDAMQLVLEHSVLSDVLFCFLLVLGVAVLGWHRSPTVWTAAGGGVVLSLAVLVRVAGEPVVISAALFCLLAAPTLRQRVVTTVVVCAAFAVPLVGYAAWFHSSHQEWALSEAGGRALYMRTTGFVDCSRFTVPSYEKRLCPREPVGERLDPTDYGWHMPDGTHGLTPPAGVSTNQAFGDFARRAIRAQPGDYLSIVARDVAMTFDLRREDRYEYDTAHKWLFSNYVEVPPSARSRDAYAGHGGKQLEVRQPYADWLSGYGDRVYTWGPLLLAMLVLAVLGLVWRRPEGALRTRAMIVLTTSMGLGLVIVPDVTAQFTWRYLLPAVPLLPMGAALAWARLFHRAGPVSAEPAPPPGSTARTEA
jgi:hypothetical protein